MTWREEAVYVTGEVILCGLLLCGWRGWLFAGLFLLFLYAAGHAQEGRRGESGEIAANPEERTLSNRVEGGPDLDDPAKEDALLHDLQAELAWSLAMTQVRQSVMAQRGVSDLGEESRPNFVRKREGEAKIKCKVIPFEKRRESA